MTMLVSLLLSVLSLLNIVDIGVNGQFNEPPGQRREQTYRVLEYEVSNINQHYTGDLRYYCTFRGKWNSERHPNDFPTGASQSFSSPVIVSHSKNYRMWTGTETVTAGVEYMAEEGYPTILYNEFDNAGFETLQMIIGERMFNTSYEAQELAPINVTYSHPFLSSMTKLIPSPDWFVGFSDLRTISYDTETFFSRIVIQSYVWDSGTDDGQEYLSFDRDLDPQNPCMKFCVPPYWSNIGGAGNKDTNIGNYNYQGPKGSNQKCPDYDKGRTEIPNKGQFLDYTGHYIPYPAEYECVLRVGDGEVYAGNEFRETQIRPPKYIPRPDDDFLEGISPYDEQAYNDKLMELYGPPDDELGTRGGGGLRNGDFDKRLLWLFLLLVLCCCYPFLLFSIYMFQNREKNIENGEDGEGGKEIFEKFVDEKIHIHDDASYQDDFVDEAQMQYDDTGNPVNTDDVDNGNGHRYEDNYFGATEEGEWNNQHQSNDGYGGFNDQDEVNDDVQNNHDQSQHENKNEIIYHDNNEIDDADSDYESYLESQRLRSQRELL